jgi:phytanoyl-CoA hydroxylase
MQAKRTGKTPGQLAGNKLFDANSREEQPSYYSSVFTQTLQLWMDHPGMAELMVDPALGKMAAELAGVQGIRIWHDQALIKEPWANPTGWHLDNPYWSFDDTHSPHGGTLSLWVALDDATLDNGCLFFIPGSHRETEYTRNAGIGQNLGELFSLYPEWEGRLEPVPVPMKAGAASFHSGMTAHGAGANMTPGRRRAMTCGCESLLPAAHRSPLRLELDPAAHTCRCCRCRLFGAMLADMPDGATFNGNPNVLPPDYLATLSVGDVLDDDELNPLLWRSAGGAPRL